VLHHDRLSATDREIGQKVKHPNDWHEITVEVVGAEYDRARGEPAYAN